MLHYAILIFNIFILEALLSLDNAAVLAIMVNVLPKNERHKALKYGIVGAFLFRGVCLIIAFWLMKILWLKILGGLYLLYLVYGYSNKKISETGETKKSFYIKAIGLFWSTVILVEIMDMAFSIDNIFAAVAMTNNIYIVLSGVFLGIISMRFIAQFFSVLITRFPTLETSAYIVILFLGIKLILCGIISFADCTVIQNAFTSHFDIFFSLSMMLIFFMPIITRKYTN